MRRFRAMAALMLLSACGSPGAPPAEVVGPTAPATPPRGQAPPPSLGTLAGSDGIEAAPPTRSAPSTPRAAAPPAIITPLKGMLRIRAAPHWDADVIGVVRAGQALPLAEAEPLQGHSVALCEGGWYAVKPRGFVCATHATLQRDHPLAAAAAQVLPARDKAYPYHYGRALGSPRYRRIPSVKEQRWREPWVSDAPPPAPDAPGVESLPEPLRRHFETTDGPLTHALSAYPTMKVSWARRFAAAGRSWLVTPDLTLVPEDRVEASAEVEPRSFDLEAGQAALPFALTLEPTAKLSRSELRWHEEGTWPARALVPLRSPKPEWLGGRKLARSAEGPLLDARAASVFTARARPSGIGPQEKWVSVSVGSGALVAYRGDRPVYAAAISPGVHGTDPSGSHHTPPGRYRVSTKWLTSDMGGRVGQGSWRTRDVPWVAYYDGSYALHGTWWHDHFGRPRSHGCINLTPADARWLFIWLDPPLPEGWYAVRGDHEHGSTVIVVSP